ncbi:MAG TPA: hypothetical protein VF017_06765 [Thermoanaerobaculia bacterium]|nr:hypothetical protein [Thermoanaerobaculia bacterium]
MSGALQALFYARDLAPTLVQLQALQIEPFVVDKVELPEERGGEVVRELAVPFLPDMDEVEVSEARLAFSALPRPLAIEGYQARAIASGTDAGVVVTLAKPGRLREVELAATLPQPVAGAPPLPPLRWVVRPADPAGGFGPPILAAPDFPPPGGNAMFPRVLSGLDARSLGGDRHVLTLPGLQGTSWLIQLARAEGGEVTKLAAQAIPLAVKKVVIDGLPTDLALVLESADGGSTPLWSQPGALLPESGRQEAAFTPLAQKSLAASLSARQAAGSAATLPLTITLSSTSGATVGIHSRVLAARYRAFPTGREAQTLRLEGERVALALAVPAGLGPAASTSKVSVRLLGRELNGGSPEPPARLPGGGLTVSGERQAALALPFLPPAPGAPVAPLAGIRLRLAAAVASEATLTLHADAGGAPGAGLGAALAPPLVRQLPAGFSGWLAFDPPEPLTLAAGLLWLVLRVTQGQLLWFALPAGEGLGEDPGEGRSARISHDRGRTWGAPEPVLAGEGLPLAQLFHASPQPLARPLVRIERDGAVLVPDWLPASLLPPAGAPPLALPAFSAPLPAPVLAALGAPATGSGRRTIRFDLFSRSALELKLEDIALTYDPWRGRV